MMKVERTSRLSKNIEIFREGKGLTQSQLASNIGVSQSYIAKLEGAKGAPNLVASATLGRISELVGVDVDELRLGMAIQASAVGTSPVGNDLARSTARLAEKLDLIDGVSGTSNAVYEAYEALDISAEMFSGINIESIRPFLIRLANFMSRDDNLVINNNNRRRILFKTYYQMSLLDAFHAQNSVGSQSNKELAWLASLDDALLSQYRVIFGDQLKTAAGTNIAQRRMALEFFKSIPNDPCTPDYLYYRTATTLWARAGSKKMEFDRGLRDLQSQMDRLKFQRPAMEELHILEGRALAFAEAYNRFDEKEYRTNALELMTVIKARWRKLSNKWEHAEFALRLERLPVALAKLGISDHIVTKPGMTKDETIASMAREVERLASDLSSARL